MRIGFLLLALVVGACSTPTLDITPRYGTLDVSGDVAYAQSGASLQTNDVEDLGLDDDTSVPGLRADFKWGMPHLVVDVMQSDFGGDGQAQATISDLDSIITAGTQVRSELDLGIYSVLVLFDLFAFTDSFELGIGVGATALDIETSIVDRGDPNNRVAADELIPLPVVAIQVGGEIGPFELGGLLKGLTAAYDGNEATYADFDAFFRWRFFGFERGGMGLVVGYRHILLDAEYEDDDTDADLELTLSGPYIGIQFSF